jgi:DNA-binding protein HU-beta
MKKIAKEKPLNQSEVCEQMAADTGWKKSEVKVFFEVFAALVVSESKRGVVLPNMGRVILVDRKARMARNPMTGEAVKVPAKKVLKFRFAKAFKESIVPKKAIPELKKKLASKKKKK